MLVRYFIIILCLTGASLSAHAGSFALEPETRPPVNIASIMQTLTDAVKAQEDKLNHQTQELSHTRAELLQERARADSLNQEIQNLRVRLSSPENREPLAATLVVAETSPANNARGRKRKATYQELNEQLKDSKRNRQELNKKLNKQLKDSEQSQQELNKKLKESEQNGRIAHFIIKTKDDELNKVRARLAALETPVVSAFVVASAFERPPVAFAQEVELPSPLFLGENDRPSTPSIFDSFSWDEPVQALLQESFQEPSPETVDLTGEPDQPASPSHAAQAQ